MISKEKASSSALYTSARIAKKYVMLLAGCTFLILSVSSCKTACPIVSCQVRMMHPHGDQEFRGVPFWKRNKNPKYGQKLPKTSQEKVKNRNSKARNKQ
ncbi:hypothetical protein [Pontibacter arcticus]|uniref:Uncharacterized protein n=1 Tax=Pontibacter arcticus TaxID=2080288 RepID=A0A364RG21_9BACT|nr:hypothetical protein [Pontibacter arcticus]RAU83205.1 hypothetical protein DP923_08260 [Pontibacter arcticus]